MTENESLTDSFFPYPRQTGHRLVSPLRLPGQLLLFLFFPFLLNAQVTSPCSCSVFQTIGAANTETDYDNISPFTDARCYFVKGILRIDGTTAIWNNVRIKMDEGAQIIVETGLFMSNTYISGCDAMWKGIKSEAFSDVNVNHSFLEDAEFAISLTEYSGFHCEYTEFIDNYIGIAVGSPFAADIFDNPIVQKGEIIGCKFYTNTSVPAPYPGHYYSTGWPTTPTEIPYDQGYAAIYLCGAIGLNLGNAGAVGTAINQIYQMRNGIITRYSVMDVAGTNFANFEGAQPNVMSSPKLDLNQYGIHTYWSQINVRDNTMSNLMVGVRNEESFATVFDNAISLTTNPTLVSKTRGIEVLRPQTTNIKLNQISEGLRGISLSDVRTHFEVRNNTLSRTPHKYGNVGIFINNAMLRTEGDGIIKGNNLDIDDGSGSHGIYMLSNRFVDADVNNINFLEDEEVDIFNSGIYLLESTNCNISRNDVFADPAYQAEIRNVGIHLGGTRNNAVWCNNMDHFYINLRAFGSNNQVKLIQNNIYDAGTGLELYSPVMIGLQEHHQNIWDGTFDAWGAYIEGQDPSVSALGSLFIIDTNADLDYLPPSNGPISIQSVWFSDELSGMVPDYCTEVVDPYSDPDTLVSLVKSTLGFTEYNDEMTWMMKADVFEAMLLDDDLFLNATLDSFFSAEEVNPLGKLVTWQLALSDRFDVDAIVKQATQEKMKNLLTELVYIDSILTLKPSDSLTWHSLRTLKADTLTTKTAEWIVLLEDEETASLAEYADIEYDLENLTTGNDMEEYLRLALLFKAQNVQHISFSGGDLDDLLELSQLCHWEAGRAIPVAMELYQKSVDTLLIMMEDPCTPPLPFQHNPDMVDANTGVTFTTFPNPTSGALYLESETNMSNIAITNTTRELISSHKPENTKYQVNLSEFPDGMYLITVTSEHGTTTQRIMLIK